MSANVKKGTGAWMEEINLGAEETQDLGEGNVRVVTAAEEQDTVMTLLSKKSRRVLLQMKAGLPFVATFFVVVASVLGTGILGLPVKLSRSGFTPFLLSYTIGFVMQALIILYLTELLQRTSVIQKVQQETEDMGEEMDTIVSHGDPEMNSEESIHETRTHVTSHIVKIDSGPDLHTMGTVFLGKTARMIFFFSVWQHFISILTSYALAGSLAYANFLNFEHIFAITPFVLFYTTIIIFCAAFMGPIVSFFTGMKGSLLVIVVAVTALVGAQVDRSISDDWLYVGKPFLIGTVALGGAVNTLPIVFSKIRWTTKHMKWFAGCAVSGLFMVYILNIIWCYYLLKIIPQTGKNLSLQHSEQEGEIATIPLIKIIRKDYPQYEFIALVIDLFIMISITVSYVTVGAGFKHVLDGLLKELAAMDLTAVHSNIWYKKLWLQILNLKLIWKQTLLYLSMFGLILLIAQTNPKGFIVIMEFVTSIAINVGSGCFVTWMFGISRVFPKNYPKLIPLAMPDWIYSIRWMVMLYFVFASVYDVLLIGYNFLNFIS